MPTEPREHLLRRRGPTSRLSRRQFLKASAGAALVIPGLSSVLAACTKPGTGGPGGTTSGTAGPYPLARHDNPVTLPLYDDNPAIPDGLEIEKGVTLKIYNWADYMYKKVLNDFCDQFDCQYEWTTFNNMSEAIQKMSSGQVADVFFPTIDQLSKLAYGKLLQPLNHSYIPNLEGNIWPVYQNPFYDQEWRYTVPYATYTTGVAYRRDHIPDSDASAQGYDMIWNPDYKGYVGIYDDNRETLAMAMLRKGVTDVNTGDETVIQQAEQDLAELIDLVDVRLTINGVYAKLPDDVFHVHQAWSGDIIGAQWYLNDLDTPGVTDVLGYWFPEDDAGLVNNDCIAIPADAEHPVLAHAFLNFLLDNQHAYDNFTWNGYMPPLTSMDPSTLIKAPLGGYAPNKGPGAVPPSLPRAIVTEDMFKKGYFLLELTPNVDLMWQTAWEQFQAGA
jgi:spermidine/putrescine transport system substrate-binding protein